DFTRPFGAFNFLGNWGGLYGHVALEATGKAWFDDVYVRTQLHPRQASLQLTVASQDNFPVRPLQVHLTIRPRKGDGLSYTSLATLTPLPGQPQVQTITVSM